MLCVVYKLRTHIACWLSGMVRKSQTVYGNDYTLSATLQAVINLKTRNPVMTLQHSLIFDEHNIILTDQLSCCLSLALTLATQMTVLSQHDYLRDTKCKAVERIPEVVVSRQHSQFSSQCQSKAERAAQLISKHYVVFTKD